MRGFRHADLMLFVLIMSAYIVSDETLCRIMTFAGRHNLIAKGERQYWTEEFLRQNFLSVNTLYQEEKIPHAIAFVPAIASAAQIVDDCKDLDYQSCDAENYRASDSAKLIQQILLKAQEEVKVEIKLAQQKAKEDEARWLAIGLPIVETRPPEATHCIIGELQEDLSDSLTDYYNSRTTRMLFLAWSKHGKNLFKEMRKAADLSPETTHLGTDKGLYRILRKANPGDPTSRDTTWIGGVREQFATVAEAQAEAEKFAAEDAVNAEKLRNGEIGCYCPNFPHGYAICGSEDSIEHKEKYSGGKGYYLARHAYSGWRVRKVAVDLMKSSIAIAIGRSLEEEQQSSEPPGQVVTRGELLDWYFAAAPNSPERQQVRQIGVELKQLFNKEQGTTNDTPPRDYQHESVRLNDLDFARMRSLTSSSNQTQVSNAK